MTPELLDFTERLSATYRRAILLLDAQPVENEIEEHLRRWAIVLGVLAIDTFGSVVVLLQNQRRRGASMLARPLVDYDIRLRFYIVEGQELTRGFMRNPDVAFERFLAQSTAVRDWKNANASLLRGVIQGYDAEFLNDEARKGLEDLVARNEARVDSSFARMLRYLLENEVGLRGVISKAADDLLSDYRNMKPNWHMQSAFLHGDQAVVSDVVRYEENERIGSIQWESPITGYRVILFTALRHMIRILRSFGLLLSLVPNAEKLADELPKLFFAAPLDTFHFISENE